MDTTFCIFKQIIYIKTVYIFFRNNAPLFAFHIIFILINLSLIASRLVEYSTAKNIDGSMNVSIMVARAAGQI